MIVYNVTVAIDESVEEDWLNWMQLKHIPDVLQTGLFLSHQIMRLLSISPEEGLTYCIQYTLKDKETLEKYQQQYAPLLQAEHNHRYQGKYTAFRTILEVLPAATE